MSGNNGTYMSDGQAPSDRFSVFSRLRLERERLKFGQAAVAGFAEVTAKTVGRWEKEIAIPADKLEVLARIGFDAQYVVTGERSTSSLSADEQELLEKYRAAPLAVKAAAIGALSAGGERLLKSSKQIFHGAVGQAIEGGISNTGRTTFNVGTDKRKGES